MTQLQEYLFGIPLSTHRDRDVEHSPFPYELLIAAISIAFFRTTIYLKRDPLRWPFGLLLGYLAYTNQSYEIIMSMEIFSYAVPYFLFSESLPLVKQNKSNYSLRIALIAISGCFAFSICRLASTGNLSYWISLMTPSFVKDGLAALFPINEIQAAYDIIDHFILEPGLLRYQVSRLLFTSFHIQCGIGYLGIDFLKQEQERRNQLVRMDLQEDSDTDTVNGSKSQNGKSKVPNNTKIEKSRKFQRSAAPFILFIAVPYMLKIIFYGNLNAFAYACFKDDVHRAVRLHDLFDHDNHLVALANHSAKSPGDYGEYMSVVVSTTYDLFNRKLFSLPKLMLLPIIILKQPKMVAQIFPIIFMTDWMKGRAVSYMTSRIEQLQKETQQLMSMRSKVESFDIKNAELLQRAGAGATDFTRRRWEEFTVQIQMKTVAKDLTSRTKGFFAWIERNFVFSVLIDCALAHLIAVGKLVSADIFVFSRAIEDAVDTALMKSRSEAELARMMTQIDNLKELASVWDDAKSRNLLQCELPPTLPESANDVLDAERPMIVLENLLYSRGTAVVQADHLELKAGVYALTGGNGSGKSTLFRVLMSCASNARSIDLPSSIVLSSPFQPLVEDTNETSCEASQERDVMDEHPGLSITMPSSNVVEISQTFYWPLYSKPIDWIYQEHVSESLDEVELNTYVRRVAEELHALEFSQFIGKDDNKEAELDSEGSSAPSSDIIGGIVEELLEEKEDWFNDLSGGQKSKVELVRKVFLQEECPSVLLVDETMAPLDPRSKSLVMAKLKAFCEGSVVIVIYHTDVGIEQEGEAGKTVECVPSNDFFDGNIHVENKMLNIRPLC